MDNLFFCTQSNILCEVDASYERRDVTELISSLTSKSNELATLANTNVDSVITGLLKAGRYIGHRTYLIKDAICPDSAYVIPADITLDKWLELSFEEFWLVSMSDTTIAILN